MSKHWAPTKDAAIHIPDGRCACFPLFIESQYPNGSIMEVGYFHQPLDGEPRKFREYEMLKEGADVTKISGRTCSR